jgi:hypothetical protein
MGTRADEQRRSHVRSDDNQLRQAISKAREYIFVRGMGVTGKWVRQVLGERSFMPIQVCWSPCHKQVHRLIPERVECIFDTALRTRI